MSKNTTDPTTAKQAVFVLASDGSFVQHGPFRASAPQAAHVVRVLARRFGWVSVAAETAPRKGSLAVPAGAPSAALAAVSPVKDPALLAAMPAPRSRVAAVAPVAVAKAPRVRKAKSAAPVADVAPVVEDSPAV
jgi:hypothetical protein